jgi:cobalt-zinc-cadmium efflux system outer membrane protein
MNIRLVLLLAVIPAVAVSLPAPASTISIEQIISMALESNPQVRAARARWTAAEHSVVQNYAPADPIFTYGSWDSPTNGIDHASLHALQGFVSLQFPGKGYLQGDTAQRTAEMARLTYDAAVRDVRARAEIQYYQLALDGELIKNATRTIGDLERFRSTVGSGDTEYSAAIGADLADAIQSRRRFQISYADDETRLNELLNRRPDEPLSIEAALDLQPIAGPVDEFIERAWSRRQEILQAALHEQNAETALTLAKLEYAPDYTVGYSFNHYLLQSDAPAPNLTETHSIWISFNLPLFFWMKQNEDIKRARYDLEAAREDLSGIRNQTAGEVTILFRHAQFDYENAIVYRDTVVPEAREAFDRAVAEHGRRGEQLATLSEFRNELNLDRASYLQAFNSLMADRIALEQEIGEPLPK